MQRPEQTLSRLGRHHRGPPLSRHAAAVGLTALLMLAFSWYGAGSNWVNALSNHAVSANVSVALLCLVLMLGAGARLIPRLRRYAPWRRELGIAVVVTASLHVVLVSHLFSELRSESTLSVEAILRFFGETQPFEGFMVTDLAHGANWLGLIALAYALVLAATSNDWSQRKLGRGW